MRVIEKHAWDVTPGEAREIQRRLKRRVRIRNGFSRVRLVGGADVSSKDGKGCAVCVVLSFPELDVVEEVMVKGRITFPYVPGLLTFREGPLLLRALVRLKQEPDIIFFDGQGIAHPLGMGIASHMGVVLGRPTLGCAKSRLVGEYEEPAKRKGSIADLVYQGQHVGSVVRTRSNVKPVFVSPGHLVSLASSAKLVLECARKYRIPEPTRAADLSCGKGVRSG